MTQRVRSVVVVGRDAALWLGASVLRMALRPAGIDVSAIELPTDLSAADCYPTLPSLEALHRQLRIEEGPLIRATRGAFGLGQNFSSEGSASSIFNAYGTAGTGIDGTDFFGHWVKARQLGLNTGLEDFSLTAAAASQGRLFIPDDESDLYGSSEYGYHLPALPYAAILKSVALAAGVRLYQAHAARPILSDDGMRVQDIELDDESLVTGDLFIDATGGILTEALGSARQSWQDGFAGDRMLVALAPKLSSTPVFADIRAIETGWVGRFPAQDHTHVVHLFNSADCSDEEATERTADCVGGVISGVRIRSVAPGIRDRLWNGNCVAIGAAGCAYDPVHGVELHAIQVGLIHLLSCFPVTVDFTAQAEEYDRLTRSALEKLRDFQSAYYALNQYAGRFWERSRDGSQSSDLQHRVATFRARGEVAPWEDDAFSPDNWRIMLLGHGIHPETYPPAIDRTDPARLKSEVQRMLGFVKDQVLRQPLHSDYLEQITRREHA